MRYFEVGTIYVLSLAIEVNGYVGDFRKKCDCKQNIRKTDVVRKRERELWLAYI